VFFVSALNLGLLTRSAYAADPREELTKAEDYFLVADFATALAKVDALLSSGDLSGGTLRDAHVLKARCEVGLAHRSSAVESFCDALHVEPGWRPDPDLFTKDELEVFAQAQTSCGATTTPTPEPGTQTTPSTAPSPMPPPVGEEKPFYKKPLFLGIGAAVLVGGIVALSGGGGSDSSEPDLQGFPEPPQ
jgi:hypothetical protein